MRLFLKLGITAFGGPAAHIAMMHDEVVARRRWLNEQDFLDIMGATNLIPGPNSTEIAIHLGFTRGRLPGLLLAGLCFITPAMFIVMGFAWAYVEFGTTPAAGALLYGIKPVIIAVVLKALWDLGQKAVKGIWLGVLGIASLALYFLGAPLVPLIFGGGILVALIVYFVKSRNQAAGGAAMLVPFLGMVSLPPLLQNVVPFSLVTLFLTFLKIGSVLYGSGYTLLAFLQTDFVERLGWLSTQQLIDAVAVGQFTPGPVFTTATFIGYVVGSEYGLALPGALLATLGIFLPSFVLVALTNPLIPRLRDNPWTAGFLDGVNVISLGLMAAVTIELALSAFATSADFSPFQMLLADPITVVLGIGAAVALFRFKVNTTWLIVAGGAIGLLVGLAL